MFSLLFPVIFSVVAGMFIGDSVSLYLLLAAQISLLISVFLERHLTGGGAFIFMSFLFFGVRPLYIYLESDYQLIINLFRFFPALEDINFAMWWGTASMISFAFGRKLAKNLHKQRWLRKENEVTGVDQKIEIVGLPVVFMLIVYQVASLFIMAYLSTAGKGLYGSALGAYLYDLPSVLQAGHIFTLLVAVERFLYNRTLQSVTSLLAALALFLAFTLEMRSISNFCGFYITGLMAGALAVLARLKINVRAHWLILPVVLLLPAFRLLGETRSFSNDNFSEAVTIANEKQNGFLSSYWDFYNSDGDINIFDTFLAALRTEPKTHPFLLSWLYVPLHFVPRALWESKPLNGTLQDMDFTNGAPYSPGIAGFFFLDGGFLWMLACMITLGYLIAFLDLSILTMKRNYLRFCLYGILVTNAMGLSRFFLWQYFYGVIYAALPCLVLANFIRSRKLSPKLTQSNLLDS